MWLYFYILEIFLEKNFMIFKKAYLELTLFKMLKQKVTLKVFFFRKSTSKVNGVKNTIAANGLAEMWVGSVIKRITSVRTVE